MNLTTADQQTTTPPPATGQRWRQALGLEFLGPVQGSGLKDPTFLVRRVDDQVVQRAVEWLEESNAIGVQHH